MARTKRNKNVSVHDTIRINGDPDISARLDRCVAGGGPYGSDRFCKGCQYHVAMHRSRVAAREARS
jgi:hypothetical protein